MYVTSLTILEVDGITGGVMLEKLRVVIWKLSNTKVFAKSFVTV